MIWRQVTYRIPANVEMYWKGLKGSYLHPRTLHCMECILYISLSVSLSFTYVMLIHFPEFVFGFKFAFNITFGSIICFLVNLLFFMVSWDVTTFIMWMDFITYSTIHINELLKILVRLNLCICWHRSVWFSGIFERYESNLKPCSCSLKRSRKFQPEDRLFSLSSVTSPAVCISKLIIRYCWLIDITLIYSFNLQNFLPEKIGIWFILTWVNSLMDFL